MKILVTGGAGFIGSHLVDNLIKEGHKVCIIDNLSTGRKGSINSLAKFYKTDICSPGISKIFKKEKPKAVFHYAAQIDVRKSTKEPIKDANINILGTLNVLENCKKFRVKKFIFASSVGVYGEPSKLPSEENHHLNPISPYSITKLAIEKYLNHYKNQGLDFVALRYANIYGPRQSGKGEGGVIAIFIENILKNKKILIYGNGKQTRDFLYVNDAVSAAVKALESPSGLILNIGTNNSINIGNLLDKISSKLNKKINPVFKPQRYGEIINSKLSFAKAKKRIGWIPKYNLEKGLEETIKWFKSFRAY